MTIWGGWRMTEIGVRELKSHFFKRENLVDIKKKTEKNINTFVTVWFEILQV